MHRLTGLFLFIHWHSIGILLVFKYETE